MIAANLRLRLVLIALLGVMGIAAVSLIAAWNLRVVSINGPLFTSIADSKDLISDILPPPAYIIEAHMVCLQALEAEPDQLAALLKRGTQLSDDYAERQRFWRSRLPEGELRQVILEDSRISAEEYFRLRDGRFVPLLQAGRPDQARDLLVGPMRLAYERHRLAIDRAVVLANREIESTAASAGTRIARGWLAFMGVTVSAAALVAMVALRQHRLLREREAAEAELREREERFRLLIENASDVITIVNGQGIVRFVGPSVQRVLGYSPEELLGTSIFDRIAPSDAAKVALALADPAQVVTVEFRIRHRDGSPRILESIGRKLPDRAPDGFIIVNSRDVTENRSAEDLLRLHKEELESTVARRTQELVLAKDEADRASRAKSTFLATMSHEIRTPMNAVLGYAQLLKRDRTLGAGQRTKVETILGSGEHLLVMLNYVLEMSKIEVGRTQLNLAPFDLPVLLDGVNRMFIGMARDKGIDLNFSVPAGLPQMVEGDVGKIRQVLINLLGNALKFTAHGRIGLRAESADGEAGRTAVRIVVSDTGPGIDAKDRDRIFGVFEQSATIRGGGAGLGLAISRELARLMEGDLTVTSTVGVGSEFLFTFSVGLAPAGSHMPHEDRIPIRLVAGQAPVRVLVVDDLEQNRNLMIELLEPMGFQVRQAASGEEGLAVHHEWRPSLVLIDAQMPGIGGLEAIRRLRASSSDTRVLLVTASGLGEMRDDGLAAGADDVLFRPLKEADLLAHIAQLLGVRYDYEDTFPAHSAGNEKAIESDLPHLLAALPGDLFQALKDAARAARATRLEEIAKSVAERWPATAAAIRALAKDFKFDVIVAAMREVDRP